MGDFKKVARRSVEDRMDSSKKWNICVIPECDDRGTHSDASGPSSYCGFHFYSFKGGKSLEDWKARDRAASEQAARLRNGGPRYIKYGKEG